MHKVACSWFFAKDVTCFGYFPLSTPSSKITAGDTSLVVVIVVVAERYAEEEEDAEDEDEEDNEEREEDKTVGLTQ